MPYPSLSLVRYQLLPSEPRPISPLFKRPCSGKRAEPPPSENLKDKLPVKLLNTTWGVPLSIHVLKKSATFVFPLKIPDSLK